MGSDQPAGTLQPSTARALGLNSRVLVSAGGGDNMMGAIGTGNTRAGVITDYRAPDPCLLAAPPDSIVSRRVEEVLPPELAALTMTMIAKVLGTGRPEVYEYGLTIDAPRRFQSRLVPMGDNACLALVRELDGA